MDRDQRELLWFLLALLGPAVGLPTLLALMPGVPRGELEAQLRRYRQDCWLGRKRQLQVLSWDNRGAVWAMDFTEPPQPVDLAYPYILVVRDLASGEQLAAMPVPDVGATHVVGLLSSLVVEHGRPLVLKADNGAAFISEMLKRFLDKAGIFLLLSPPGTPRYNGACEAGIGSLKTRAHHAAVSRGRAGYWTCDDVEVARQMSNNGARPNGPGAMPPTAMWANRVPLTAAEQGTFAATVRTFRGEVIRHQGTLPGLPLSRERRAQVDREVLTRALLHHALLSVSRRRYPQHIPRRFRASIM